MSKTVISVFRDYNEAEAAMHDLAKRGFPTGSVSLIANDSRGDLAKRTRSGSDAGADVGTGAALGSAAGLMIGLAALALPGIGPVVAAGPMAAALAAAGLGAAAGSIVAVLRDAGVPEDHALSYSEAVREGGTLLVVRTDDSERASDAKSILDRHGALQVKNPPPSVPPATAAARRADAPTYGDEGSPSGIPSTSKLNKRRNDPSLYDRERDVVPDPSDDDFRRHYESTFAGRGPYDQYSGAYRFGATLGSEPRYNSCDWGAVESDAKRRWETDHPGTWKDVKDAVRHAWDHMRGRV